MKHIPNILSSLRIVMIPFFVWAMVVDNTTAAGILLLASGVTDFLDGKLARSFGWITPLGKILDPVADKLTHAAVSITLMIKLHQYWYFFALLILKDIAILAFGGSLMKKGVKIEGARWFGKVSTFVFYAAMLLVVLVPGLPGWVVISLLVLATGCALVAALLYIPEYRRYKKGVKQST